MPPGDRFPLARVFAGLIALIAWAALVLQYALLVGMTYDGIGPLRATLRFASFFTVLSNLLVALTSSFALIHSASPVARFFNSARVRGAAALCVGITCLIYYFVLAATWSPQGLQLLADVALHYVVPVFYLLWWIACAPHGSLQWGDALRWLIIPFVFLMWVLIHGALWHEYPYPFLDVDALGLVAVTLNAAAIGVLFLLAGFGLIAFDRTVRAR